MKESTLGEMYWEELESEGPASRKCLERIPESLYAYKPHEKSMAMGYLAILVAEIPKWIQVMAEGGEIDFATWKSFEAGTTAELLEYFDQNMAAAKKALQSISDEDIKKPYPLKNKGQVVMNEPTDKSISSSINHLVHHRGQLSVYMRLNDIKVPAIYGPSADER